LFGLVEILVMMLVFMMGPFVLGFVFGLIDERVIGLLLLFTVYVLLVLFWQGGLGIPSGPPTYAKANWFLGFYLLPALVGYAIGYFASRKGKLPTVRLLRKK
jgi:hypothetical protein